MKHDITTKADIKTLVDAFYNSVRTDAVLAPVFALRISEEQWPAHLEHLYAFWNAILLGETGFSGNPMQKHLNLPVEDRHFDRWLELFRQAVDENFGGPKAKEAKQRAEAIAGIMLFKINSLR